MIALTDESKTTKRKNLNPNFMQTQETFFQDSIIINRTYCEIDPESAEDGEFSATGFISHGDEVTFRELVALLQKHPNPSSSHGTTDPHVWWSTGFEVEDYSTGTEREECVHCSDENSDYGRVLWIRAVKVAGFAK